MHTAWLIVKFYFYLAGVKSRTMTSTWILPLSSRGSRAPNFLSLVGRDLIVELIYQRCPWNIVFYMYEILNKQEIPGKLMYKLNKIRIYVPSCRLHENRKQDLKFKGNSWGRDNLRLEGKPRTAIRENRKFRQHAIELQYYCSSSIFFARPVIFFLNSE